MIIHSENANRAFVETIAEMIEVELDEMSFKSLEDLNLQFAEDSKASLSEDEATIFYHPSDDWFFVQGKLATLQDELIAEIKIQHDHWFLYQGPQANKFTRGIW